MAAVFEVWHPNGRLKVSRSTRFHMILGTTAIGGAGFAKTGSIAVPQFALGDPFIFTRFAGLPDIDGYMPSVWIAGHSINWSYRADGSAVFERPYVFITYGLI